MFLSIHAGTAVEHVMGDGQTKRSTRYMLCSGRADVWCVSCMRVNVMSGRVQYLRKQSEDALLFSILTRSFFYISAFIRLPLDKDPE